MTHEHAARQMIIAIVLAACALTLLATRASAATVPEAPSDAHYDAATHVISWQDNSDDEDGFRLLYTIGPGSQPGILHTVAANGTSFTVPEAVDDSSRRVANIVVTAFNAAGDSFPALAEWDGVSPPPSDTVTVPSPPLSPPLSPPEQLSGPGSLSPPGSVAGGGVVSPPNTGSGAAAGDHPWTTFAAAILFAASAATLAGAFAVARAARRD